MSLDVFPSNLRGLTYPVEKTSEFNTLVQSAPNFLETTVAQTRNPRWEWQLIYDVLWDDDAHKIAGYADYRRLQGFLLKMGGRATEFLYNDPTDNSVGPALIAGAPNPLAALQLVDDGAGNFYSPIQRNFGGQFYEDVTDLNGGIAVYANGILQNNFLAGTVGAYTIVGPGLALPGMSFMGLVVKWAAPPTGPINAAFNFYFRAKFGEDRHDFTNFMNQFWTLGGSESSSGGTLTLRSSRPVQV